MIRPYQCHNCAFDAPAKSFFYADDKKPLACVNCGLSGTEYPEAFLELVSLHFIPPHPVLVNKTTKHRACNPAKFGAIEEAEKGVHGATGEAPVVTCYECRRTKEYQESMVGKVPLMQCLPPKDEVKAAEPDAHAASI